MKTQQQIKDYALEAALGHFFSNVDEEGWPVSPLPLLAADQFYGEDGEGDPFDMVPWEPFETYPAEWFAEEVEALASQIERAMIWAQQ